MPYYYNVTRSATTNGTGNTCSSHIYLLTIANQQNCAVVQIMASVRNSTTAGSGFLSINKASISPTLGGANTPTKANNISPAAQTTAFDDTSVIGTGGTTTRMFAIGFAQTGGQGGWVALERDNAQTLNPNGGANGNLKFDSFTATASQALEVSCQFLEG